MRLIICCLSINSNSDICDSLKLEKVYIENTKYFWKIVFIEGIDDGKMSRYQKQIIKHV